MKHIKIFIITLFFAASVTNTLFSQEKTEQVIVKTETITLKVNGVGCSGDANRILANVEKQAGVTSCKIVKEGAVTKYEVVYNPALVTKKELYAAVENTDGCASQSEKPYKVKNK